MITISVLVCICNLICGIHAAGMITVSGVSSGGAMAVQYHVAHASTVGGAGVVAGTPYYCANLNIANAVTACAKYPDLISVPELVAATRYAYTVASIDNPQLMINSKVWLFSGTLDSVVNPGVMKKVQAYYQNYISASNIQAVFNIHAEHSFVTDDFGSSCEKLASPYINNCGFDSVGQMFKFFYGSVKPRVTASSSNIKSLGQAAFVPLVSLTVAAMADNAYFYVPTNCKPGSGCGLHVAYHGCEQGTGAINNTYYMHTGYNEYAESNNIVILYPQAKATALNPLGCWDWWGYTGADYATKAAVQIAAVKNMVDYITKNYL